MTHIVNSWEISAEPYIEENDNKWEFCPNVLKDESFLSWFTRLSKENCSDSRILYQQLKKPNSIRKINMNIVGEDLNSIILSQKKQDDLLSALQPYLKLEFQIFQNPPYLMENTQNPLDFLCVPLKYPRFCPHCLAADNQPYFRDWWFYKPHMVCPIHRCLLLDACPHCNSPIQFWSTTWNQNITCCSNCGEIIFEGMNGTFELKNIDYYDILNESMGAYAEIMPNIDHIQFFRRIWEIILSNDINPWVKTLLSNNTFLSSERLFRMILIGVKELARMPAKLIPTEVLDNLISDRILLEDLNNNPSNLPKELNTEKVNERLHAIAPLIKMVHKSFDEVKKQSMKNGISPQTLYRWMKHYKKEGIFGLVPKYQNCGKKKSTLSLEFEVIVKHAVEKYMIGGEITTIKALYEKLIETGQRAGASTINFTYMRLYRRIRQEKINHACNSNLSIS